MKDIYSISSSALSPSGMKWKFVKGRGITFIHDPKICLYFDQLREDIRKQFHFTPTKNNGRFVTEDSYQNLFDKPNNWIRLGFEDGKLAEIEVLEGLVEIDGLSFQINEDLNATLKALEAKGYKFKKGDYSHTDFDAKIDIGDSGLNGGMPNQIVWFYTARNFDHDSD